MRHFRNEEPWKSAYWSRVTQRRLSRRVLLKVGAFGTAGLAGAAYLGCGDGEEKKGVTPTAGKTVAPEGTPKPGGSVTVLMGAPFSTMDSAFHSTNADKYCIYNVYEPLTAPDTDEEMKQYSVPFLAEKWEQVDDKTINFQLRRNVKFHDGTDVDSAAVKAYYDMVLKPETASPRLADMVSLDHVESPDASTVTMFLKRVDGGFLGAIGRWAGAMRSPTAVAKWGNDYQNHPVGAGAFMFKRQEPGVLYEFERNPDYWQGPSYLDGYKCRVIPDKAVAAAALKAGEIDYAAGGDLDTADLGAFQKDADFDVVIAGAGNLGTIWVNKKREPGNNIHLRKAISYAIDRDEFVQKYGGLAFITPGPLPKYSLYETPDEPDPEYSPEKAKEELKAAGYQDGLTINLVAVNDPILQADTELLAAQLGKVGISVKTEFVPATQAGLTLNKGEYDFAYGAWPVESAGDIDYAMTQLYHSKGFFNNGTTSDPEIDTLVDSVQPLGPNERADVYRHVMKIVVENAYMVYVVGMPQINVIRKNVRGYIPMNKPHGFGLEKQFRGIWLA